MSHRQYKLFEHLTFNDLWFETKTALNLAASESGLSRDQLLDLVNKIAGKYGVTLQRGNHRGLKKSTLEKWITPSDKTHIPSTMALLILCVALNTLEPITIQAKIIGGRLISDKEARLLDWAKAYHRAKAARKEMKNLEEDFGA